MICDSGAASERGVFDGASGQADVSAGDLLPAGNFDFRHRAAVCGSFSDTPAPSAESEDTRFANPC